MRLRLNLEYHGASFQGWQLQPDAPTVQGKLENALAKFYGGEEIRVTGSGRTDTGVHAVGQVSHADVPETRETKVILKGLNALLPSGVRVWGVRPVESDFHSRFQATERVYGYRLLNEPSVFGDSTGWNVPFEWQVDRAREVEPLLLGSHDFTGFATRPDPEDNPVCDLRKIEWEQTPEGWVLRFTADRYLRRMVRTLVGTLVEVGAGRLNLETVKTVLETKQGHAGVPAPPQGLALLRVRYDTDVAEDRPGPSPWGTAP